MWKAGTEFPAVDHGSEQSAIRLRVGYPTTGFTLERMRGLVQPGLMILMLVLMLLAPAHGIFCRQACALCAQPQGALAAATSSSHCPGMTGMVSQKRSAESVGCCQSRWPTHAVVLQGRTHDATALVSQGGDRLSAQPVAAIRPSIQRVAPPGVPHARFLAMRV